MNFEKLPPVPIHKEILDLAFRKAREKGSMKDLKGSWIQIQQQKESLKLDVIKSVIISKLDYIVKTFPDLDHLPTFYHKLLQVTLDYAFFKKSLGAMNWAMQKIRSFQSEYVKKIRREHNINQLRFLSKEFYGRISSLLKQINPQLIYLEEARRVMCTYPDIKEMFTVCIYGFPNVGKTTLFNKLAGTKAKVAAYAFTTKSINSGFMKINDKNIQFLDVPGTLSREDKLNPIELQAELVVDELANVIIYVFDLSEQGGYSIKKQEQLWQKINRKKNVLIYLSKLDLTDQEVLSSFKHKYYSLEELMKKIELMN